MRPDCAPDNAKQRWPRLLAGTLGDGVAAATPAEQAFARRRVTHALGMAGSCGHQS
ncbi:hypothetical protein D9M68_925740 [compost metagenome]